MALAHLAELDRGERIHRLERDELAPQTLQVAERVGFLGLGPLVIDLDGLRIRQRLVIGEPELLLRRREAGLGVALLIDERPQAGVLFSDALLGRGDLLVERVAEPDQRRPALLARGGIDARVLGALRRRGVRVEGGALGALRDTESAGGDGGGILRGIAAGGELLAARDELRALALDRDRTGLARADEVADIGLGRAKCVGGDLELAALALRVGELAFGLGEPRRG